MRNALWAGEKMNLTKIVENEPAKTTSTGQEKPVDHVVTLNYPDTLGSYKGLRLLETRIYAGGTGKLYWM
jgi:hypothetical protein